MGSIPCVLMRGGTSRGPFFLASDLPRDPGERDAILIAAMGSGHPLQIDGIGGGNPLTSKVAICGPATKAGADVDYLFAQVDVSRRTVDTSPNCGNMLAGVGPFALEAGLVPATHPRSRVIIHNVNTGKLIEATVETPNGRVTYEGHASIDGVPGTAAPIRLTFLDAAGAKTGKLFPTGQTRDGIDGVAVTCIDMAVPMVLIAGSALGKTGQERPADLDADGAFLARLETIRRKAGLLMGFGDVSDRVVPKPVLLASPVRGGTITARYFMPRTCHTALAITGAIGIATACCAPGTEALDLARLPPADAEGRRTIVIEHPSGKIAVELEQDSTTGSVRRASLLRTARRLFEGRVLVPEHTDARAAMVG